MKKIALTGANGFVGSNLTRKLLAQKYQVVCLVRPTSDLSLLPATAEIRKVDYHNSEEITEILSQCDVLIHTAALTRSRNWQTFYRTNVQFTEELIAAAEKANMQQVIFISSQAAAGPASDLNSPLTEQSECHPVTWYGKSKMLAEEIVKKSTLPTTIIRPVSVFGPGDKDFLIYFKMLQKHLAAFIGCESKYLSLIYIEDLVNLIVGAIGNPRASHETFFAASTPLISMREFVDLLQKVLQKKALRLSVPHFFLEGMAVLMEILYSFSSRPPILNRQKAREFEQKYWLVSNHKAVEKLNFQTQLTLEEQIQKTYSWYKEHKWL